MNAKVELQSSIIDRNIFKDIFGIPTSSCSNNIGVMSEKAGNTQTDALQAVKMDPAVLEAQVTLGSNDKAKINVSSYQRGSDEEKTFANIKVSEVKSKFEKAMLMQEEALLSLSPQQFQLLLKYVDTLRKQRLTFQKQMECAFCKNNGHPETWYNTHALKDGKGRVRCPILRALSCRRCGATGDDAHTIRYCPER